MRLIRFRVDPTTVSGWYVDPWRTMEGINGFQTTWSARQSLPAALHACIAEVTQRALDGKIKGFYSQWVKEHF